MSSCRTPCNVSKCQDAGAKDLGISGILVLIGAIVSIVLGIFDILGSFSVFALGIGGWSFVAFLGEFGWIWTLIWGIVALVIGLMLLSGLGFIKFKWSVKDMSWIWLLVLGLIIAIPTSNWGGFVIVVAAIVKIVLPEK